MFSAESQSLQRDAVSTLLFGCPSPVDYQEILRSDYFPWYPDKRQLHAPANVNIVVNIWQSGRLTWEYENAVGKTEYMFGLVLRSLMDSDWMAAFFPSQKSVVKDVVLQFSTLSWCFSIFFPDAT